MKKKIEVIILISCILCLNIQGVLADSLQLSGESYILMDEISGRVLVEKNAYRQMPMASTTKIMTALVAIENTNNIEDKVLIDEHSIGIEGSSIYLEKDEVISLKDLLYGLMLQSGNDAAIAISRYIGNTEDRFVSMMNDKAMEIDALSTHFENPHGLNHVNHYSTSYDLAIITREALKNSVFTDIFSTKSYTANRPKNNYFINKNKTLWEYEGGDGGKTGYTTVSGRCLVSTSNRNGFRLIAVSLNAPNWFNDNYRLLDYGFENYKHYLIYDKGQFIEKANVLNGKNNVDLVIEDALIYPLREEEKESIKTNIVINESIHAPVIKGERLGYLETYLDGKLIRTENLLAKHDVDKKNIIDKILKR